MDWKLIEDKSWSSLEQQFEWVREMNTVPQDTRYHAEGNVAVHTRMVLEALQQSAVYQYLSVLECKDTCTNIYYIIYYHYSISNIPLKYFSAR